jgi:hypothetical protein
MIAVIFLKKYTLKLIENKIFYMQIEKEYQLSSKLVQRMFE